jgi:transcriptional regulator with XRE-family HTH domain
MDSFGVHLRTLREGRGLSQLSLANATGLSQSYISEIEAGKKSPTLRIIQKIAYGLHVPIIQLIPDDHVLSCEFGREQKKKNVD